MGLRRERQAALWFAVYGGYFKAESTVPDCCRDMALFVAKFTEFERNMMIKNGLRRNLDNVCKKAR